MSTTSLPDRDVYLVAADAATTVLKSQVPNHAQMLANYDWFIAGIDAAVRHSLRPGCDACLPVPSTPIDIHTPIVLKQAQVTA